MEEGRGACKSPSLNIFSNPELVFVEKMLTLKSCSGRHIGDYRLREGDSFGARGLRLLVLSLWGGGGSSP